MASPSRPLPVLLALVLALAWPAAATADHDGGSPPSNDSSQQSWLLNLNSTVENHENTGATVEAGERLTCGSSGYRHTVWYYFEISSQGRVVVTVTGASLLPAAGSFDSVISLQGSQTGIGDRPLACNDDDTGTVGGSRITVDDLSPGRYFVQVGGFDPDPSTLADPDIGRFSIEIRYTEDLDRDNDGVTRPADCNDDNPAVKPGAPDVGVNGIDDNCDGITDPDKDSDGYLARPHGNDCNDTDASINPGAREIRGNKVDENCDGKNSPFPRIRADTDYPYDYLLSGIRIAGAFKLTNVPSGARSTVICRAPNGRPCGRFGPTLKRSFPQMNGKRLGHNSVIIVRVKKRNYIGRYIKITVLTRTKPKKLLRCMNPGSSKPQKKCPGIR